MPLFFLLEVIFAWVLSSKNRKTKLLILADPPLRAKKLAVLQGFAADWLLLTEHYWASSFSGPLPSDSSLFFRTGLQRAMLTSNSPELTEATEVGCRVPGWLAPRTIVRLRAPA